MDELDIFKAQKERKKQEQERKKQEHFLYSSFYNGLLPVEDETYILEGNYVGDALKDKLKEWAELPAYPGQEREMSIIISAQTGKGKNHFVTHELREFALRNHEKILYVSNRVALDYQQKRDLFRLIHPTQNFGHFSTQEDLEARTDFGNIIVITYHKLFEWMMSKEDSQWNLPRCRYVVLDECHFFYSDAMFNAHTWEIMMRIPSDFSNSYRIYMSATPEEVLNPIHFCENRVPCRNPYGELRTGREWVRTDQEEEAKPRGYLARPAFQPFVCYLPRDYSNYHRIYFSKWEQISERICKNKTEKWVIFVNSSDFGERREEELKDNDIEAIFINRGSRMSADKFKRYCWQSLLEDGTFEEQVLLTTQVVDNGFSLYDKKIENIVLFTHDRTEFLQELGRYRLPEGKKVNVYIKKLGKNELNNLKDHLTEDAGVISGFIGCDIDDELATNQSFSGDNIYKGAAKTVKALWRSKKQKDYIWFRNEENKLIPQINNMARWHVYRRQLQLKEYEAMLEEDPVQAPILWKERWFYDWGFIPSGAESDYEDLDLIPLKTLQEFLQEYADEGTIFTEPKESEEDKEFNSFSSRFQELYVKAYPGDTSVNSGKKRKPWGARALNNHMKKVEGPVEYSFQSVKDENGKSVEKQYQVIATLRQEEANI